MLKRFSIPNLNNKAIELLLCIEIHRLKNQHNNLDVGSIFGLKSLGDLT